MNSKAAYRNFLKTNFWRDLSTQKKKIVRKCEECGSKKGLQSHHKFYRSDWFKTTLEDLRVLCRKCHGNEHGLIIAYNGIIPYRKSKEFNETVHRCSCLKRKIEDGRPLRDRDRVFLNRAKKKFKPTKKDGAVAFHVDLVFRFEKIISEWERGV